MSDYPRGEWHPRQSVVLVSRLSAYEKAPFVVRRARGPFLYDIEGYKYIDFFLQNGEVILGYKPEVFQRVKNHLNRVFYGATLSLAHYRLEKRAWEWLEKEGIKAKSLRFFESVGEAFLFLQEWVGFSSWVNRTWSVRLPQGQKKGEVVFFESVNSMLEEEAFPSEGMPILVENGCFGRLSSGLSLHEGWEIVIVGGVLGNGAGGAMLVSRQSQLPVVAPLRTIIGVAMQTTLEVFLRREKQVEWPVLPSWIHQKGGIFVLPEGKDPSHLLSQGIFTQKVGFFSLAHGEHEVKRLVRALQGQGEPSS
ncbi:MAG: hypothetical protein N2314_05275 [Brevinematales bacterium]|nr:hypothetical protein [Brevinematales bacterium]